MSKTKATVKKPRYKVYRCKGGPWNGKNILLNDCGPVVLYGEYSGTLEFSCGGFKGFYSRRIPDSTSYSVGVVNWHTTIKSEVEEIERKRLEAERIANDAAKATFLRQQALEKLTPEERAVLGV